MDDKPEQVTVRKLSSADAPSLERITRAVTGDGLSIDFRSVVQARIAEDGGETSMVAEMDGEVVGYMIAQIIHGGFGLERGAWIVTLGVDPEFMGRGIGKKMALEIFRVFREKGVSFIYTSVRWDSADLLSFFKTLGFDRSDFINLGKPLGASS
jgi:ribosomal protein S18 acetylase RimI-like enzyme